MFVIFIRTVIIFILLEFVVRLMGKRHMGELEIGELITTIMISEIATLPLQDASIPVLYALVPISVLMVFEIGSSVILTKFPRLKALVTPGPSIIIEKGILKQYYPTFLIHKTKHPQRNRILIHILCVIFHYISLVCR